MHIDVESPVLERIIHEGETTLAKGKKKGLFIALKKEMASRAMALRPQKRIEDFTSSTLEDILRDRTSGSLDLLRSIISIAQSLTMEDIEKIMNTHGSMGAIYAFCERAMESGDIALVAEDFSRMLKAETRSYPEIAEYLREHGSVVVTISRSSAVREILRHLHNAGSIKRVLVLESRPGLEGITMARELRAMGIDTIIMTDASVYFAAEMADYALVGCDAFHSRGYINKTGTRALARAMQQYGRNVFVATSPIKRIERWDDYMEMLKRVDMHPDSEIAPDIDAINRYFEYIPRRGDIYLHEVVK